MELVLRCACVWIVLLVLDVPAGASDESLLSSDRMCQHRAECMTHFADAQKYHQTGQSDLALRELRIAYEISQDATLLASMGLIHQKQQRYAEALVDYRSALAQLPKDHILHHSLRLPMAETTAALQASQPRQPVAPASGRPDVPTVVVVAPTVPAPAVNVNNHNSVHVSLVPGSTSPAASEQRPQGVASWHRWVWPGVGAVVAGAGIALGLAFALRPTSCNPGIDTCANSL